MAPSLVATLTILTSFSLREETSFGCRIVLSPLRWPNWPAFNPHVNTESLVQKSEWNRAAPMPIAINPLVCVQHFKR